MFVEFVMLPTVGCILLLIAAWRALSTLASAGHWSSWVPVAVIAGAVGTLLALALLHSLREELRKHRERREQSAMEQRYPGCHVLRLSNGQWFLTDRYTGREYLPDAEEGHSFTPGRTRDGSSRCLQQFSNEVTACAESRGSQ
ncbi:hypothetical protein GGD68_007039 [Paraburkholderia fungorum]|jgi:hypothetical protein|uniref:hypothetical protein n=1 Tax=Paraburkholderia fungorum TaxID=134537 RepID=UPI00161DC420|nr:hypothetical protein [Paraburkholderia fungorum]MBB4518233.1 hypothetical protein [Paraburkholderia fungorum]